MDKNTRSIILAMLCVAATMFATGYWVGNMDGYSRGMGDGKEASRDSTITYGPSDVPLCSTELTAGFLYDGYLAQEAGFPADMYEDIAWYMTQGCVEHQTKGIQY